MAISKTNIKNAIKQALITARSHTDNPSQDIDDISEAIADSVALEIKRGIETMTFVLQTSTPVKPVTGTFSVTIN